MDEAKVTLNSNDMRNLFITIDRNIKLGNYTESIEILKQLSESSEPNAIGRLARLYRDGKGVPCNMDEAIRLYAEAYLMDAKWRYEYIDSLYRSTNSNNHNIAYIIASETSSNEASMGRLGRMYRDGKGIKQDLEESIRWYELACQSNKVWLTELIDVLLRTNSYEHHERAKKICFSNLDKKNDKITSRIGRIYRDGKGVDRDYSQSAYWFGKAYDLDANWKYEYIDVLLKSTEKDIEHGISLCKTWADRGDAQCMVKLSRLIDLGIAPNAKKEAILWAKKAYSQDGRWLYDYLQLLLKSNETGDIKEAFGLAKRHYNDPRVCSLIGKYYCSTFIDLKNHIKAKEWYEKCDYSKISITALDYADLLISFQNPEDNHKAFYLLLEQYSLGNTKVSVRLSQLKDYATSELKIRLLYNWLHDNSEVVKDSNLSQYFKSPALSTVELNSWGTPDPIFKKEYSTNTLIHNLYLYLDLIGSRLLKNDVEQYVNVSKQILQRPECQNWFYSLYDFARKQKLIDILKWIFSTTDNSELKIKCALNINKKQFLNSAEKIAQRLIDEGNPIGYAYLGRLSIDKKPDKLKEYFESAMPNQEEWVISNLFKIYSDCGEYNKALSLCEGIQISSPHLLLQYIDLKLFLNPEDEETKKILVDASENNILIRLYLYEWVSRQHYNYTNPPKGLRLLGSKKESLVISCCETRDLSTIMSMFPLSHYVVSHMNIKGLDDPLFPSVDRFCGQDLDSFDKILKVSNDNNDTNSNPPAKTISVMCGSLLSGITGFKEAIDCCFGTANAEKIFKVYVPHKAHGLILSAINYYERINTNHNPFELAIDLSNFPNSCTPIFEIGQYDAWGYYFKNTTTFDLSEIYQSNRVQFRENDINANISNNDKNQSFKDNFKLSDAVDEIYHAEYDRLYGDKKNVLGVIYRGTDHLYAKGLNHPIPYDYQELLESVRYYVDKYDYKWIYLNTEDLDAYNLMVDKYGSKIIALDQKRYSSTGNKLIAHIMMKSHVPMQSLIDARNYLITILLSSNANGFLASHCFGSEAVKKICSPDATWYPEMIKGRWQVNGKNPIIAVSTNKNLLKIVPEDTEHYNMCNENEIVFKNGSVEECITRTCPIRLNRATDYVFSSYAKGIYGTVTLSLYSESFLIKEVDLDINKFHIFSVSEDANLCKLTFKKITAEKNNILKIQLEHGVAPSSFINHYESTTEIALRDIYGILRENDIKEVDFTNGCFISGDTRYLFNTAELRKWTNMIKYESGSQYYILQHN